MVPAVSAQDRSSSEKSDANISTSSRRELEDKHEGLLETCFGIELQDQARDTPDAASRLRKELGLEAIARTEGDERVRYGVSVSTDEAELLDAMSEIEQSVDTNDLRLDADRQLGASLVGIHWDIRRSAYVVTTTDAKGLEETPFGENVILRETANAISASDSSKKIESLKGVAAELLDLGVPGWNVDETCGVLEIRVHDSADMEPVRKLVSEQVGDHPVIYRSVDEENIGGPEDRNQLHFPYKGGAWMTTGSPLTPCTTSLGWWKDEPGSIPDTYWGVVAAHCLQNQPGYTSGTGGVTTAEWYQSWGDIDYNNNGPTTTYFMMGAAVDTAVVQLDRPITNQTITFDPSSGADSWKAMNWWDWSTSIGSIGNLYCHTGLASNNEICGTLTSKSETRSYNAANSKIGVPITLNELWEVTATSSNGDSGGPWWRRSGNVRWAAGVHHGKTTNNWPAFTHISYIKLLWGLKAPSNMW